jgi:hypothetical protein
MSRAARSEIRKKIRKTELLQKTYSTFFHILMSLKKFVTNVFCSLYVSTGNNFSRNFPSKQIAEMIMALTDTK